MGTETFQITQVLPASLFTRTRQSMYEWHVFSPPGYAATKNEVLERIYALAPPSSELEKTC